MPYYGDALPYYYGGPFSNHSSLMTGIGRTLHSPLGSTRYAPHLTTISESPLSALRRYSPAATMTSRPKRVIDTADIDVSTPRALSNTGNNNNQRNRLRRDRPTIRIRSQALKDNPALREHYERHEKTVGELLVEKFLIKEKKNEGTEVESRTKLYSQISLENDKTRKQRDDLQEALKRRITRRMTRRRSSADVQMDPQQLERELLFAQAQADALDTLVAQEQAEIEVETRMGTLIRKNLVRSIAPLTIRSKQDSQGLSGDEDEDTRTSKLAKKVKKRRKTTDKPSPPSESELDSEQDEARLKKAPKDDGKNEETNEESSKIDEKLNGEDKTKKSHEVDGNEDCGEGPLSSAKGLKFKIEASNSVGDFSTLWINGSVTEEHEKQRKISQGMVEQYRDSVRLPAPKQCLDKIAKKNNTIIEEHQEIVVLPVKKRYVKDDARNSVYLTLKTQKSAGVNKNADTNETIDRIEAINGKADQSSSSLSSSSTMTNREAMNVERSTNTSSAIDDTTTGITRQPRVNKVAKFRSKDITESDIEVKSISELPGAGETEGKIGTKDASLKKLSGSNDNRNNVIANESISAALNRDASVESAIAKIVDRSNDQISAKFVTIISEDSKNLEIARILDTVPATNDIDNSISIEVSSTKDDETRAKVGIAEVSRERGFKEKIGGKPLKRAKKETEDWRKNNGNSIVDESKRLKQSVVNSRDSSSTIIDVENLEDRRSIDDKELPSNGKESVRATITSIVSIVESLPDASTFNLADNENGSKNDTVKIHDEEFNADATTEKPETRIAENIVASEDLPLSRRITGKFVETRGEISKTIGITSDDSEVNGLENSRTVVETCQKIAEQPTITNESPKILKPARSKDVNFVKFNDDKQPSATLTNNTVSGVDATGKDKKNVVELSKLRKNRKILPLSSRNDSTEIVELSPDSPDLDEIVPERSKKIQTQTSKSLPFATNGAEISRSKIEKSSIDSVNEKIDDPIEEKVAEKTLMKKIESVQSVLEPAKLINGVLNKKFKTIAVIQESSEPEVDVKIAKKAEASYARKDEEIDFWGEIESQRIAEPSSKIAKKIVQTKENISEIIIADTKRRENNIHDSMLIVALVPGVKSDTSPETGTTTDETRTLVGGEKKLNKVKRKKKTSENVGCKKNDQEKASSETIFERFASSYDVVDEKSHRRQQEPERLEQRQSVKLNEKSTVIVSGEEKIVESPEIDRFERNLSTIVEEGLSPISEELPRKIKALDLVAPSLREDEEEATAKLDTTRDFSSTTGDCGLSEKTPIKDLSSSSQPCIGEPEVAGIGKYEIPSILPIELEKQQFNDASLAKSEATLPRINIVEASSATSPREEILSTVTAEEAPEDEAEDDPGTPTNETIDEIINNVTPKNITKWHGLADLSLDEPDKDIGPEVGLETTKNESVRSKKKIGSSKKTSKKKSSNGSSSSLKSTGVSPDSSSKKKLPKRKKSSTKNVKDSEKRNDERSESKLSNSSDTTLKPGGPNIRYSSPKNSGRNSPKQRPLDLIKMFYTTPALLLTATPRDLSKVRRAKVKKRKHSSRTASASSDSTGSTRSTQSTGTAESTGSTEHDDDTEQKRISSTRSNDSGFDGSPRLSNCDMACHKKCEKLTGNLCGLNQKLVAEALQALKKAPSQSSDNQRNSDGSDHQASGRITPPATNLPRFKKYTVLDFNFLKVLGKGSFGKVLLAELRRTDCVYAVKCLKKDVVLEDDDVECTLIERKVLTLATRHPYLCHLFCTFQTDSHLFFVMEYLNGGDLMFHIQKSGRFAESRARFYAAEIWSGLNFLHKKGIVYRDLKLDNVLLDFEGHIRIADFGMCKLQIFLDRTADTFCGTPDYMAPEIIKGLKYNQAVDWWSFGVLLYEMLTGQSPFSGCDEDDLFWSICNERPFIPRYLSQEAMDVLICLLEKDAGKRPPAHEIAVHPFFHTLQWDRLERRQLEPPFKPALEHTLDTRYFDTAFTAERPRLTPVPEQILTSMDQGVFRGFSYTNPNATD